MRSKTIASLIILCGSTAAFAQMTTPTTDPTTQTNIVGDNAAEPGTAWNETVSNDAAADTATNTADDAPPQR